MPIAQRRPVALALLALTALALSAGCDWLETSGSSSRVSPMLSGLSVSPRSVFCGSRNKLEVSFGYSDLQDDIAQVTLIFEQNRTNDRITRTVAWTDLDLATSSGRAIYREFFFPCEEPSGDWTLTAQAEDEKGHQSNEVSSTVTLVSSR